MNLEYDTRGCTCEQSPAFSTCDYRLPVVALDRELSCIGEGAIVLEYLETGERDGSRLVRLEGGRVSVGRANTNDIVISDDNSVSRVHAVFERHRYGWYIRDAQSRNGISVDGKRILCGFLPPDAIITIGIRHFVFRVRSSPPREGEPVTLPLLLPPAKRRPEWDLFISHAHEDKEFVVDALAESLRKAHVKVWYDSLELRLGDHLRESIETGLRDSRYGLVVLSTAFFGKRWPRLELDALAQREEGGDKVILPLWYGVTADDVRRHSLLMADRVAVEWSDGLPAVTDAVRRIVYDDRTMPPVNKPRP